MACEPIPFDALHHFDAPRESRLADDARRSAEAAR